MKPREQQAIQVILVSTVVTFIFKNNSITSCALNLDGLKNKMSVFLNSNALWPLLDAGFAGQYIAQLSVPSHGNVVLDHAEPPLSITELHGIKY